MCLKDPYGRIIDYLRVSVTDRCNLNCAYCRPENSPFLSRKALLTSEEILAFCREAAILGIRHIKITGGEPLLRTDCCSIVEKLKKTSGIETVTLTTNGLLLREHLGRLKEAGIDGINISMDTPDRACYAALTGSDRLPELLDSIRSTAGLGIPMKINCVIMDGLVPVTDYLALAEMARSFPADVRFIEAMPFGSTPMPALNHLDILKLLSSRYPDIKPEESERGFGPAVYYRIPGFTGCIGFISAVHGSFCYSCNRIRLTADGFLKGCLGFESNICIKPLFRQAGYKDALQKAILRTVSQKPPCHCFGGKQSGAEHKSMSKIGG